MVVQMSDGATGSHGQRYRKKKCNKCDETKPIYVFHKSKRSPDGFSPACRECLNLPRREREAKIRTETEVRTLAMKDLLRNHRVEFERLLRFYTKKLGSKAVLEAEPRS